MTVALVTGGYGFVGSSLRPLLRERGMQVAAVGRRSRAPEGTEQYLQIDLTMPDGLADALDAIRPDLIFHLAASSGQNAPGLESLVSDAVIGTHALCSAIRRVGLRTRVVLAGSSAQYGDIPREDNPITEDAPCHPATGYGFAKLAAEATARALATDSLFEVIPVRAFNHVGPREPRWTVAGSFARRVADVLAGRAERVEAADLEVVRDFTDVRDVARGYLAIAERGVPGRVYNICSGLGTSVGDVLDGLLTSAGLERGIVDIMPSVRPGLPYQVGSPTRVRGDTGWKVTIPLNQSLDDLLESIRAEGASGMDERRAR